MGIAHFLQSTQIPNISELGQLAVFQKNVTLPICSGDVCLELVVAELDLMRALMYVLERSSLRNAGVMGCYDPRSWLVMVLRSFNGL